MALLADGRGAAQQLLEARCETGVAGIKPAPAKAGGLLGVAQQVRKTELAFLSMPGLCGPRVRPSAGPRAGSTVGNLHITLGCAEKTSQYRRTAAVVGLQPTGLMGCPDSRANGYLLG